MGAENKEIERKYLVKGDAWRQGECTIIRQGYLNTGKERTVRVRTKGEQGYLTIKGITKGVTRDEYEYEIPVEDANDMLETLCYQTRWLDLGSRFVFR
jgi:adenylate cyclase